MSRKACFFPAALALSGCVVGAAPFLAVEDGTELFLTATVAVRSDDNVLLSNQGTRDTLVEFTPGLDFVYGAGSLARGHLEFKERILRHSRVRELDTSLPSAATDLVYDDQKARIRFDASWTSLSGNLPGVANSPLVDLSAPARRDVYRLGGDAEVNVTESSSALVGIDFEGTRFKNPGYADARVTRIPLGYFRELAPKADLSLGLRLRKTSLHEGVGSSDLFYSLGARGELGDRLSGVIALGYIRRSLDRGRGEGTLGLDSSFSFSLDEHSSLVAGFVNDYDSSPLGQSRRQSRASLGFRAQPWEAWSFGADLSRCFYKVSGLSAETLSEASLSANYVFNTTLKLSFACDLRKYDSDQRDRAFDNAVFTLSLGFRY